MHEAIAASICPANRELSAFRGEEGRRGGRRERSCEDLGRGRPQCACAMYAQSTSVAGTPHSPSTHPAPSAHIVTSPAPPSHPLPSAVPPPSSFCAQLLSYSTPPSAPLLLSPDLPQRCHRLCYGRPQRAAVARHSLAYASPPLLVLCITDTTDAIATPPLLRAAPPSLSPFLLPRAAAQPPGPLALCSSTTLQAHLPPHMSCPAGDGRYGRPFASVRRER